MTLLNTTFVLHAPLEPEFLAWLKATYLPSAAAAGIFGTPVVSRVLTRIEPETESIAVQLPSQSHDEAERWLATTASLLHDDLHARWGDRLMFFSTMLETISL